MLKIINRHNRQNGFTLLELMISLVLALIMAGSILVAYSNTRISFIFSNNVSQLQESGRFSLNMMSEDIRLAGYWGINVWPSLVNQSDVSSLNMSCGAAGWITDMSIPINVLNDPDDSDLPSCINSANHVNGTDIIMVRHAGIPLDSVNDIVHNEVYFHSGMFNSSVFKAAADDEIDTAADFSEPPVTIVYPFETHIYYVRPCSQPNTGSDTDNLCDADDDDGTPIPTLIRQTLSAGVMSPEGIAQYVENMQIILGEDSDDDGAVDVLGNASGVSEWDDVRSVDISLLVRAPIVSAGYLENIDGPKDPLNSNKRGSYTFGGQTILKTDNYRRRLYSNTISLQNQPSFNEY